MGFLSGIVVYIIIWWVVFFMCLPLRVQRQKRPTKGTERGAPENPHLKFKFWLASCIAAVLWGVYYALIQTGVLTHEFFV